jgi:hypothetical protein
MLAASLSKPKAMRTLSIFAIGLAVRSQEVPTLLRVDGREVPVLGVESRNPTFQWAAPSDQQAQAASQVRVFAFPGEVLVWDSGRLNSSVLSAVYAGPSLQPMATYAFAIRSWGASNATPSEYSYAGLFATGVWDKWSATPIWHPNASSSFTFLRSEFRLPSAEVASAYAFVTANPQPSTQGEIENAKLLAAYRLYVDATWIGVGPGRPGSCGPVCPIQNDPLPCPCSPHHWYDTYNITDEVRSSEPRARTPTSFLLLFRNACSAAAGDPSHCTRVKSNPGTSEFQLPSCGSQRCAEPDVQSAAAGACKSGPGVACHTGTTGGRPAIYFGCRL